MFDRHILPLSAFKSPLHPQLSARQPRPVCFRANMTYSTALVTGASRGIGLGLVRELLAGGATVVATVRSSSNGLSELASEASGRLHIVQLDTGSAESIAACVEGLKKEFQHFDVRSSCAGCRW